MGDSQLPEGFYASTSSSDVNAEISAGEASGDTVTLRELLANQSFLLVWVGRNFCRLGDSIHEVVLAWIVFKLTGSALAMGAMLAVTALPQVLLLLVGGIVSERLSRRNILLVTDGISFIIVSIFALMWHNNTLTMPIILLGTCILEALTTSGVSSLPYSTSCLPAQEPRTPRNRYTLVDMGAENYPCEVCCDCNKNHHKQ